MKLVILSVAIIVVLGAIVFLVKAVRVVQQGFVGVVTRLENSRRSATPG